MPSGDFLPYTPCEAQAVRLRLDDLEARIRQLEAFAARFNQPAMSESLSDADIKHLYPDFHI